MLESPELAANHATTPIEPSRALRFARDQWVQSVGLHPPRRGLAFACQAAPFRGLALEVGPGERPLAVLARGRLLVATLDGGSRAQRRDRGDIAVHAAIVKRAVVVALVSVCNTSGELRRVATSLPTHTSRRPIGLRTVSAAFSSSRARRHGEPEFRANTGPHGLEPDARGIARAGLGAAGCRDWSVTEVAPSQGIAVSFPNGQRTLPRPVARTQDGLRSAIALVCCAGAAGGAGKGASPACERDE